MHKYFKLITRFDDLLDLTPACEREYRAAHACRQCFGASAEWRRHPVPIDVEIVKAPRGPIAQIGGGCFASVVRADLARVLEPHLPRPLFGSVAIRKPTATDRPGRWVTCVPGEGRGINAERGENCRHVFCVAGCGGSGNWIGWAEGAVVARDVRGVRAFFDFDFSHVFVSDELAGLLELKVRFPDLRFKPLRVVEEPLDGEVLPGDPGWDGVFRPRPQPKCDG